MDKRIAYYRPSKRLVNWPKDVLQRFEKSESKYGVMYFEEGSEEEHSFLALCGEHGLGLIRGTMLKCTGKDLYRYPFHYLTVKMFRKMNYEYEFMDFSTACNNCNTGIHRVGATQVKKIQLDSGQLKSNDILEMPGYKAPNIFLISRNLKDLMESENFTGYRLIPCLEKGRHYSEKEMRSNTQSKKLENEANYFQLIITDKIINPPDIGRFRTLTPPCPVCNTFSNFIEVDEFVFHIKDLQKKDFQILNEYNFKGMGRYHIGGDIPIISSRVLRLFIENKIKGLYRYMTDPPVKYGIVEIEGITI
ncbi:hypothetical protein DENIS_1934 [Desulfonema ishimotonii]|uniref:Uncharacterized protein n=1 Tax=Desulfonema ishimotonii TaxID=45657 RepID=A0A401FVK9_9BACT|nr:hypothetical protein [Desulfonema ishimotonii]GBC60974.1 hypothetical protein DENIS_1934 [Desulfonema ishimotonii]